MGRATTHVILWGDAFHYLSANICCLPTDGSHITFIFVAERIALFYNGGHLENLLYDTLSSIRFEPLR